MICPRKLWVAWFMKASKKLQFLRLLKIIEVLGFSKLRNLMISAKLVWKLQKNTDKQQTTPGKQILNFSKRKSNSIETDDGKSVCNLLELKTISRFCRRSLKKVRIARELDRTFRNFLQKPAYEKENGNRLHGIPSRINEVKNSMF